MEDPNSIAALVKKIPPGGSICLSESQIATLRNQGHLEDVDQTRVVDPIDHVPEEDATEPLPPRSDPRPRRFEGEGVEPVGAVSDEPSFGTRVAAFLECEAGPEARQAIASIFEQYRPDAGVRLPMETGSDRRSKRRVGPPRSDSDENHGIDWDKQGTSKSCQENRGFDNFQRLGSAHGKVAKMDLVTRPKLPNPRKSSRLTQIHSPGSSETSSASDDDDTQTRAKDSSWPHPLAKLVNSEKSVGQYLNGPSEGRELITQHRDFVRDRTKGLKRTGFPTHRVGWHNGLLAIQLAKAMDIIRSSVLSKEKHDAYKTILDLGATEDNVPLIDLNQAKNWIKEERKRHAKLTQLIMECAQAADHEANIARIVEKDGFSTVAAFEGSEEFDSDFKRHLEYVRKEAKKGASVSKTVGYHSSKRDKTHLFKPRPLVTRHGSTFGRSARDVRPMAPFRTKFGPSAARPCNVCKSSDHWAQQCPLKGK